MQSIFEAEFYFCVKCMLQIQQCLVFKFSWNFRCKYFKFHANILSNPQILSESLLGFTFIHAVILNKSACRHTLQMLRGWILLMLVNIESNLCSKQLSLINIAL